jgi:SAM-dependent methyltransferase
MTEFSKNQFDLVYPNGIENHWWQLARNRIVLRQIKTTVDASSPILEVGCGRGIVVQYLQNRGIDCTGVDTAGPSPLAGMEKYLRLGIDAVNLPAAERTRFGVILLLDVVEHLENPAGFLKSLQAAFANVKRVIVTVPARQELWSNYDEFYGHHRRYSADSLRELAIGAGWEMINLSYFFRLPYLPMRAIASTGRKRAIAIHSPQGEMEKRLHQVLSLLMLLDYYALPGCIPGSSLIATLRVCGSSSSKSPLGKKPL